MLEEAGQRRLLVELGRRAWERRLVAGTDGNLSTRLSAGEIMVTPSGRSKGFLDEGSLLVVDPQGNVLRGQGAASSELRMHLACYGARPDVGGVVHAHPPFATGFALAGRALDGCALAEVIVALGSVPLIPYETPGTQAFADLVGSQIRAGAEAMLLANHGALAVGETVERAYEAMEALENYAQMTIVAELLGGARTLPPERVEVLAALRRARPQGWLPCAPSAEPDQDIVNAVTATVWERLQAQH